MTPSDSVIYPQMSVSLSPHQKSFFLQYIGNNRDSQLVTMREWDGRAQPERDIHILAVPLRLTELHRRVEQKDRKSQRQRMTSRNNIFWTQPSFTDIPTTTVTAHARPVQVQPERNPSTVREQSASNPTTIWGAMGSWELLKEEESVSLMQWCLLGPPSSRASLKPMKSWATKTGVHGGGGGGQTQSWGIGADGREWIWEESEKECEYDQIHCSESSKN